MQFIHMAAKDHPVRRLEIGSIWPKRLGLYTTDTGCFEKELVWMTEWQKRGGGGQLMYVYIERETAR